MDAHLVEESRTRLAELRRDELQQLCLGGCAVVGALAMTAVYEPLVLPLYSGGFAVLLLGVRSLWRHWDLVDRLSEDPSAHVISEVAEYARRHTHDDAGSV